MSKKIKAGLIVAGVAALEILNTVSAWANFAWDKVQHGT